MTARNYLRELRECVQALPGFMVKRLEALVAEMEQAEAEPRADLEKALRVIREMACPACQGDGGWIERVDETSSETCRVECSRCGGTGIRKALERSVKRH